MSNESTTNVTASLNLVQDAVKKSFFRKKYHNLSANVVRVCINNHIAKRRKISYKKAGDVKTIYFHEAQAIIEELNGKK
jgi:hypothetical protein